ncbi:MAG: winged helix-turn-helix domain-containing protein [Xanthobacteraceae bacterium]
MQHQSFQFEEFTLDLARLRLDGPSGPVSVRPKAFEVLRYLVENAGRVVAKDEIMKVVWPGVTVTDESLTHCVSEVRRALGDKAQRMVRTAPRRGYLFDAPVATAAEPDEPAPPTVPAAEPVQAPVGDRPSIAVLPFANMTGDPEQDYLADGIVEDLITALSRFRRLLVIARNSSFVYKGRAADVRDVARELGVRYVLEGSVRRAGSRIRITGQLIEASTATHLWADRYDGEMQDVFDLQDRITRSVAGAIEPQILVAEIARATRKGTAKLDAYDHYLRARRPAMTRTRQGLGEAIASLQLALEADPTYAQAWAMLAVCTAHCFFQGFCDHDAAAADVVRFVRNAVAYDGDDAEVLAATAFMLAWNGDHDEAVELARRAIELNSHSNAVCNWCLWALVFSGSFEEAIALYQGSLVLDPLNAHDPCNFAGVAAGYFYLKNFDTAAAWAKRAATKSPEHTPSLRYLAAALAHSGRLHEATAVVEALRARQPNSSLTRSREGTSLRHAWMRDLYVEGLRLAGLPD